MNRKKNMSMKIMGGWMKLERMKFERWLCLKTAEGAK